MAIDMKKLKVNAENGSFTFEVIDQEARDAAQAAQTAVGNITIPTALPNPNKLTFTGGASGTYDGSKPVTINIPTGGEGGGSNVPITYVESLDDSNLANLRDLDSGTYVLYGYFTPYSGAPDSITINGCLAAAVHLNAGSHVMVYNPRNFKIECYEVLVDESAPDGFTYTRDTISLLDLLSEDKLQQATNDALAQAKASGEFDGEKGDPGTAATFEIVSATDLAYGTTPTVTEQSGSTAQARKYVVGIPAGKPGSDGHTPVKGADYWTQEDIAEIDNKIALGLADKSQTELHFVASVDEMTDQNALYVLDGYIWAYMGKTTTGGTSPNFTNVLDTASISLNDRYSLSSHSLKGAGSAPGFIAIDHITVQPGQVIRVNKADAFDGNYSRIIYYDSGSNPLSANDVEAYKYAKLTKSDDVVSFVAGYYNATSGNDSTNKAVTGTTNSVRLNLYIAGSSITEADLEGLILTVDEEITYTSTEGGTEYTWCNTGHAFAPADYEDRILLLESLAGKGSSTVLSSEVFAPAPQLAADGSDGTDFNAADMTAQDIFNYMDAVAAEYPNYITRETLGRDAGNALDVHRYVLCRRYYNAWQRQNYPAMYGWANGSTVIYSRSVSPRIGDTMYTTAYIGTAKGTVTAVNNTNQSRTVGGVVYTRSKANDVAPTLVYTSILTDAVGNSVYNVNKAKVSTISSISATALTTAEGLSYDRYPMGDRDSNMQHFPVVTLIANEHGYTPDPRIPAIVCARLIRDLAECRKTDNPFLNRLKNQVMLVIIPVLNPHGFNLSGSAGYYNANGVNINRNYDCPGWGNLEDAGPQGDYGGSETETQYAMNTITEAGAAVAISIHALGYTSTGGSVKCHYQGNGFSASKIADIAEILYANYGLKFTDYGTADPESTSGGKSPAYITWAGARGGIIEMQAEGPHDTRYTATQMEANYTMLLQCINMWLSDAEAE